MNNSVDEIAYLKGQISSLTELACILISLSPAGEQSLQLIKMQVERVEKELSPNSDKSYLIGKRKIIETLTESLEMAKKANNLNMSGINPDKPN